VATKSEWITQLKADNPTLNKMVNGVTIQLTSSEYDETIDRWADANVATEIRTALEKDGGKSSDYKVVRSDPKVTGSYPSIGDQLDMQYHDEVNGTTTWKDAIAATKAKFQKPD